MAKLKHPNAVNIIDFGQSPDLAVANARMHHQWFPDELQFEGLDDDHPLNIYAIVAETYELDNYTLEVFYADGLATLPGRLPDP